MLPESIQQSLLTVLLSIITATLCGVALVMVIIRLVSRQMGSQSLTGCWDDALVVVSWLLALPSVILAVYLADLGIGKDIWNFPLDSLDEFLRLIYIGTIISVFATGVVKIPVLVSALVLDMVLFTTFAHVPKMFYLRVFPSARFRRVVRCVIGLCVAYTLAFTIAFALQCDPISYSWRQGIRGTVGTCIDLRALALSQAVVNMLLDVIIMMLPMPTLYKLHVGWKQKLQIMVMFGFGSIVIVVCILRVRIFARDFDSDNVTAHAWTLSVWSVAELFTSIVCACLPAAKVFFQRSFKWSIAALREQQSKRAWRRRGRRNRDLEVIMTKHDKEITRTTTTTATSVSTTEGATPFPDCVANFSNHDGSRCLRTSTPIHSTDDVPKSPLHLSAEELHGRETV